MNEIETLITSKLETARVRGERILPNGTRLISPAPEIAPQAWHYVLFAPLEMSAIEDMEMELGIQLPVALRKFFKTWNGVSLFGYQLEVWGKRNDYTRVGDDAWQPFDLVGTNLRFGRPKGSPETAIYIGSAGRGEKWIFLDLSEKGDGRVGSTARESFKPDEYWPDFTNWLECKFTQLWRDLEE